MGLFDVFKKKPVEQVVEPVFFAKARLKILQVLISMKDTVNELYRNTKSQI